jgi:hypothetical protein
MKISLVALMTLASTLSSGCSVKHSPEPIVVHVFLNATATEADLALVALGEKQLRASHGQPIMIATWKPNSYVDGLAILGHQVHPELIILDSLEDAKKVNVDVLPGSAMQVAAKRYYPAVPSWASGEPREAAEIVLTALSQELKRAGADGVRR